MTFFEPDDNCWRVAAADTFAVLIDGENYFRAVRSAMMQAQERIVLIGWDFDARVKMYDTQGDVEGPLEIGEFIDWLVRRNPALHIYILQWNVGAIKLVKRGRTLIKVAEWLSHPRVHVALDGAHPVGAAQHEKLIIVDQGIAFCGGIDITEDRWDTRDHRDVEEKRKQPTGIDTGPWHDAAARLTGEIARSLGEHAEKRWEAATGERPIEAHSVIKEPPATPHEQLEISNVDVAIARTRGATDAFPTTAEIEALYCGIIEAARDTLYIESQYFTSKVIARALAQKLLIAGGPEIVLVLPANSDGWLEQQVMDSTRARLITALRAIDHEGRFAVFHPMTEGGADIYVHAKITIADQRLLRVGSSNIANRSMGFDSECDVCLDAQSTSRSEQVQDYIKTVLIDLLSEHLGSSKDDVSQRYASSKSLIATIRDLSRSGRGLREYETPDLSAMQEWLSHNDILDPLSDDTDWPSVRLA
ncbi:MAG: phospholipase D-like domain-containing protein [Pseudomonadota bacterium]